MDIGKKDDKILITGDDVLIEYVDRIIISLKIVTESNLKPIWRLNIEKFISHYVWHFKDLREADTTAK